MDPYSAAAKLIYKALAVLVVLGALVGMKMRITSLTVQRDAATAEATAMKAEIAVQLANAEFSASLAKQAQERARSRSKAVEQVRGGIVHVDVPEACRGILEPLRSARDGLLRLQAAELRVASTAGPDVRE